MRRSGVAACRYCGRRAAKRDAPMSRKRHFGPTERYVRLRYWLLQSAAWQSLPAIARALYIELAMRYNGCNNGRIAYAVRQAAKALHISAQTAMRALQLLQDCGFIRCTYKGSFTLKTASLASEWRLTEYAADAPVPAHATKDFMRWRPPAPEAYAPPKSRRRLSTRKRTLPSEEPSGSCDGSAGSNNTSHGSRGGSVNGQNRPRTLPREQHLQLPSVGAPASGPQWSTPKLVEVTDLAAARATRLAARRKQ
jgi:hypothetical protein